MYLYTGRIYLVYGKNICRAIIITPSPPKKNYEVRSLAVAYTLQIRPRCFLYASRLDSN